MEGYGGGTQEGTCHQKLSAKRRRGSGLSRTKHLDICLSQGTLRLADMSINALDFNLSKHASVGLDGQSASAQNLIAVYSVQGEVTSRLPPLKFIKEKGEKEKQ